MSGPADCRWCRPLAFLASGLFHLGLAAALLWPAPRGGTTGADDGDRAVGVTLAMFGEEPGDSLPSSPEPVLNGEAEADTARQAGPVTSAEETPEPPVPPEPRPEPDTAPGPEQPADSPAQVEPDAAESSESAPRPETKAEPEPVSEPKEISKPVPEREPKREAVSKPKPKPRPKTESRPKTAAAKKDAKEASKAPAANRKEGGSAARGASRPGGGGSGGARGKTDEAAEGRYLAELQRAIAKHRRYPREAQRRELEGVVTVYFVVLADGRIRDARIAKSSGSALLDKAAVETLKRLHRFKPIPREIGRSRWPLRVPIRFALR